MPQVKAIHMVYATWCPHSVPTVVEPMKKAAIDLGVELKLYDIDTEAVRAGDELVKAHGDDSKDYLVPQVFFEFAGGEFKHMLTGYSEGVELTKRGVERLLSSDFYKGVKQSQSVPTREHA